MTRAQRDARVNELRDMVITRDGLEVEGTIKVCDYIEHMERTCDDINTETGNDLFVALLLEVIAEYSEGGAL